VGIEEHKTGVPMRPSLNYCGHLLSFSFVCLSVCQSVTQLRRANTVEKIEVSFEVGDLCGSDAAFVKLL